MLKFQEETKETQLKKKHFFFHQPSRTPYSSHTGLKSNIRQEKHVKNTHSKFHDNILNSFQIMKFLVQQPSVRVSK